MNRRLSLSIPPQTLLLIQRLYAFLQKKSIKAYAVGGLVRDALLGRDTADIDIAVVGDALEIAHKVASSSGGSYVLLDEVNKIGRVILREKEKPVPWTVDFSTLQGTIEEDLSHRDFTIDAMAFDLEELAWRYEDVRLIDPLHGHDDLSRGVLRSVAEEAFTADPARLMRAMRLVAELGFTMNKETETQIQRHAYLITSVAGERLREELLRLLGLPQSSTLLVYLDNLGLLTGIIPELGETKGVTQPKEHFWNVFEHSIKTLAAVDFLLRRGVWEYTGEVVLSFAPWSEELCRHFDLEVSPGSNRRLLLKLAALLHDIAKPQTKAVDVQGRTRFLGHGSEGAEAVAGIMARLRFSVREMRLVVTMVKEHLRPAQLAQKGELPSRRAIYRYFRDTDDAGIDVLFLSLADHLAARGPNLDLTSWQEHTRVVAYMLEQYLGQKALIQPKKLLTGDALMSIFALKPGPKLGRVLAQLREAEAAGEIGDREKAIAYVKTLLEQKEVNTKDRYA